MLCAVIENPFARYAKRCAISGGEKLDKPRCGNQSPFYNLGMLVSVLERFKIAILRGSRVYLSNPEGLSLANPSQDIMQIPSDFRLDASLFEDILDLEACVRLAASGSDVPGLPGLDEIHDAWIALEGRLPQALDSYLGTCVERMLDASRRRDSAAIVEAQKTIATHLTEFRKRTA
ncbi:hypothetical protein HT136_18240 [Novosphingobium profundi]|uniref:hypothetical protein n=1 Tax=Novosphingobium profundi TaxID=1774954 RepID=UPI001BD9550F|nr:hypothetical protein [Novosphingobium profundi]MBT0670310.1 hypothetical protein [Novosphingobium profundi]